MIVCICPGVHDSLLTQSFLQGLESELPENFSSQRLIFPTEDSPAYSAFHVRKFLHSQLGASLKSTSVLFLAFSAGVVAALGAALALQLEGGTVRGLIAVDGWGVPLYGNFPVYRFSHDYFTHWSSSLLGAGEASFYCDPPVAHLELWRSPQTARGWWVTEDSFRSYESAAHALVRLVQQF